MSTFSDILHISGVILRVIWDYIADAWGKMSWEDILPLIIGATIVLVIWFLVQRMGWLLAVLLGGTILGLSSCSNKHGPVSELGDPPAQSAPSVPPMV